MDFNQEYQSKRPRRALDPLKKGDMHCIIEPKDGVGGLYLGNMSAARKIHTFTTCKINSILTVSAETWLEYDSKSDLKHYRIKALDTIGFNISKHFDEGIQFIRKSLESGNILVHCFAGISRSATIVIAYLMQEKSMNLKAALELVQSKRTIASPNDGFMRQLSEFEDKLLRLEKFGG